MKTPLRSAGTLSLALLAAAVARAGTADDAAVALYKSKQYPEAREAFARVVAANPQDAEAHFYLGAIAQKRNDTDEAISHLEIATSLDPRNPRYFLELGAAYGDAAEKAGLFSKLNLARKCQAALEKAVELDPDSIVARNGLITYYRRAPSFAGGGMSKAYDQAREIRKRDPVTGANVLAQLYLGEKKYEEAFDTYQEVLDQNPDQYLTLYAVGRTAAQTGIHLDRGEQSLRRCLDLTPGKDEPAHAAVHWRLGNIAERRNDAATARAEYESSLKADPNFTQARESLEKLK